MSTAARTTTVSRNGYPTSDGQPMAETDYHRDLMLDLITTLQTYYAADPLVYVSGNLLLFYEEGNKRRHLSPDVFVVQGVPKRNRLNYLMWEEGKGPDVVIELTSSSTRKEDEESKLELYRDTLKVREYFLFDPLGDYLKPPMKGYRLRAGKYVAIRPVQGRLPSRVLSLHLERDGKYLRLYDPARRQWLPTLGEEAAQARQARHQAEQAELAQQRAEQAQRRAEQSAEKMKQVVEQAKAENERLRREVEELRRRLEK